MGCWQLQLLCASSQKVETAMQRCLKYHPAIQPDQTNTCIIEWTVLFIEQFDSLISWLL